MTNAEMIEKARRIKLCSTPAVEHVLLLHNVADALEEADKRIAALRTGLEWFANCDNSADWIRADGILTDDKEQQSS